MSRAKRADRKDNKVMILNYYTIELVTRKAFLSSYSAFCEETAKGTCILGVGKRTPESPNGFSGDTVGHKPCVGKHL